MSRSRAGSVSESNLSGRWLDDDKRLLQLPYLVRRASCVVRGVAHADLGTQHKHRAILLLQRRPQPLHVKLLDTIT